MKPTLRRLLVVTTGIVLGLFLTGGAAACRADDSASGTIGPDRRKLAESRKKAIDFLRNSQADDGSWTINKNAGITGLVTAALLENGLPIDDPTVSKALKHLETYVQKDGGIHFKKSDHKNYETCIALLAFQKANADGRYTKTIENAAKFLRGLQWDQGEGVEPSDEKFGGAGYGSHKRPDLSNTQFLIEALKASGAKEDDPAIKNAILFVSRTQNLESEHNTTSHAAKVNDGGFYYTPAAGGSSQAGKSENGGLRSYGSMTYAGLKSMIYAGLKQDDPRVKAAFTWIRKHYSVKENPGLGQQGVYYYYQTFAKSLAVLKLDSLTDDQGRKHDWRKDLSERMFQLQTENGSWVNKTAERWMEGDPNLATAYGLMVLASIDPKTNGK